MPIFDGCEQIISYELGHEIQSDLIEAYYVQQLILIHAMPTSEYQV